MNNEIKEMRKYLLKEGIDDVVDVVALMTDDEVKEKYKELNKKGVENYKIFEPGCGEECWCIDDLGEMYNYFWRGEDVLQIKRIKIGNIFETEKEAEQAVENLKVHQELKELSNEISTKKIDWEDEDQFKYCLIYDHCDRRVTLESTIDQQLANAVYFVKTRTREVSDIVKIAIERIGEERLINYLKGC